MPELKFTRKTFHLVSITNDQKIYSLPDWDAGRRAARRLDAVVSLHRRQLVIQCLDYVNSRFEFVRDLAQLLDSADILDEYSFLHTSSDDTERQPIVLP